MNCGQGRIANDFRRERHHNVPCNLIPRQRANGLLANGPAGSSGASSVGKASCSRSVSALVWFAPIIKQAAAVATGSSSDAWYAVQRTKAIERVTRVQIECALTSSPAIAVHHEQALLALSISSGLCLAAWIWARRPLSSPQASVDQDVK